MEVVTKDPYEASFYLLSGCEIDAIQGQKLDGKYICSLTFTGTRLGELQAQYFSGEARVELFAFRRTYGELTKLLSKAKKQLKDEENVLGVRP